MVEKREKRGFEEWFDPFAYIQRAFVSHGLLLRENDRNCFRKGVPTVSASDCGELPFHRHSCERFTVEFLSLLVEFLSLLVGLRKPGEETFRGENGATRRGWGRISRYRSPQSILFPLVRPFTREDLPYKV